MYYREIVLLSGRLPRQCDLLYRNDREFDKFPSYLFALERRRSGKAILPVPHPFVKPAERSETEP